MKAAVERCHLGIEQVLVIARAIRRVAQIDLGLAEQAEHRQGQRDPDAAGFADQRPLQGQGLEVLGVGRPFAGEGGFGLTAPRSMAAET